MEGEKAAAKNTGSQPRSRTRDSAAHRPPDEKHESMLARGRGHTQGHGGLSVLTWAKTGQGFLPAIGTRRRYLHVIFIADCPFAS